MKSDAEYKRDERDRKKAEGKKRIEFYVYTEDIHRIKRYVIKATKKTKIKLDKPDRSK